MLGSSPLKKVRKLIFLVSRHLMNFLKVSFSQSFEIFKSSIKFLMTFRKSLYFIYEFYKICLWLKLDMVLRGSFFAVFLGLTDDDFFGLSRNEFCFICSSFCFEINLINSFSIITSFSLKNLVIMDLKI